MTTPPPPYGAYPPPGPYAGYYGYPPQQQSTNALAIVSLTKTMRAMREEKAKTWA